MTVTNSYKEWHTKQMEDHDYRDAFDDYEIAFQIARLRMLKGITQAQLAEMVGTKQSSIARLESGTTMPRLSFLRKVVTALGGHVEIKILSEDEIIQEYEFSISTGDEDEIDDTSSATSSNAIFWYSLESPNVGDPANELRKIKEFA